MSDHEIPSGAHWLWLDPARHPDRIQAPCTWFAKTENDRFTLAEFRKTVKMSHSGKPHRLTVDAIFGDNKFRLTVNGRYVGTGPVAAGGDWANVRPMPVQYLNRYRIDLEEDEIEIVVQVHIPGAVMTDYSCGRGGFIFAGDVDGMPVLSDETWRVRVRQDAVGVSEWDFSRPAGEWEPPHVLSGEEIVWNIRTPDIPMMTEETVCPIREETNKTDDGQIEQRVFFGRIYSAFIMLTIRKSGMEPKRVKVAIRERDGTKLLGYETVTAVEPVTAVRTFRFWSIGEAIITCPAGVDVSLSLSYVHYPVDPEFEGYFACSDELLSETYRVGKFTLEMCRQTCHLDSPKHQEALGCTGDYAIESLMTRATFGDMRLARLDLKRTADYITMTDGYMFHTTYSFVWVMMMKDYVDYTGDVSIVSECMEAMKILFRHFEKTVGTRGVIETPPSYMFVEFGELDGYSTHHPPAALGQTVLNAFYQGALRAAAALFRAIGRTEEAERIDEQADAQKIAFRRAFFDPAAQAFRDGFVREELDNEESEWLPRNAEKNYHTRQANTLAVLYGLSEGEEARELAERIVTAETLDGYSVLDLQPYFMHYVMEMVWKTGLFETHGLRLLRQWKRAIGETKMGMKEGWGEFIGDSSHSWGATPTYQLPMRLLGFELVNEREFTISPRLFGLEWAKIRIPLPGLTPTGTLTCDLGPDGADVTVTGNWREIAPGRFRRS